MKTLNLYYVPILLILMSCKALKPVKPEFGGKLSVDNSAEVVVDQPEAEPEEVDISFRALQILEAQCASCHNLENPKGGFGTVLSPEEMIKSNYYLIPGDAENSEIIKRLAPVSNMPPSGEFSEDDRAVLVQWINELEVEEIVQLTDAQLLASIRQDLEQNVAVGDRPTTRYFSLQAANNAGLNQEIKDEMIKALNKTLNSISRANNINLATAIDEAKLIYRVNLRNYAIDPVLFDTTISDFYPFQVDFQAFGDDPNSVRLANDHVFLKEESTSDNYVLRMDWFNATATLPVVYARLFNLPLTQPELEAQLAVDRLNAIINNQVIRAGFRNSAVSSQNRIMERISSNGSNLAFWISYDFADNNESQQNIFNFPLGPVGIGFDARSFEFDGGEIIFQLPNGMFGYYLSLATGESIHKGPLNIVKQTDGPAQFNQAILNGMSCMSCHNQGLLYKKDEIRSFASLSQELSNEEKNKVINLYRQDSELKAAMDQDNARYFQALQSMEIDPAERDPVNYVYRYYNQNLFRSDVMAELGLDEAMLNTILNTEPFRSRWVSIYNNSGSITREEFNQLFGLVTNQFKLGVDWVPPLSGDHFASPDCMVSDAFFMDTCTEDLSLILADPEVEPAPEVLAP
ncbi:MAG: c-type cytochrome domain-containing protein [Oligoflexus sp.]